MMVEHNQSLQSYNSFGILARAQVLVRVRSEDDLRHALHDPSLKFLPKFVLGGGSNLVLTGDLKVCVLKMETLGRALVGEDERAYYVQAEAGENWHDFVAWTLEQGWAGLENLAMIPGTVGATPVQNIGAYGVELQDRFHELDAIHLETGESFTLNAAQCAFGYRDSVFKHGPKSHWGELKRGSEELKSKTPFNAEQAFMGLAGQSVITRVRFRLPKKWVPVLDYQDLQKRVKDFGVSKPSAQDVFGWVCDIRREKLPDPKVIGNVGSFFKNPTVSEEQCKDIIAREPSLVHYALHDGNYKLAAGWLIDACGWKGKSVGQAAVYEKQALVLVNKGGLEMPCTGGEVMTLARAIQTSVYERFGIRLEPEPLVL